MKEKICQRCKKYFIPKDKYQKVCSDKCRYNWPDTGYRICEYCGKRYYYTEGQLNWKKNNKVGNGANSVRADRFCSYACGMAYRRKKMVNTRLIQNNGIYWTEESIKKSKDTCLKKYGVDCINHSKEIRNKINKIKLLKYGTQNYNNRNKAIKTWQAKYGEDIINPSQVTEIKKKKQLTAFEHFGGVGFASLEIRKKIAKSRTYTRKLKTENKLFEILKSKFPNTIRQYYSEKYPFNCDFYIPELDLYIEYQGYVAHGNEPFDKNNPKHIELLKELKKKAMTSSFYKGIIDGWTIRDPLKRKTARKNNLNWIEFFTMKEFENWFKNLP